MAAIDGVKYLNISATGAVKATAGILYGIIVNSNTSGTLKLWDSASAAGNVIMNTFTFAAGSSNTAFAYGISFNTALFATIGGTADITLLYI